MKRQYIKPESRVMSLKYDILLVTASPGVGDPYDPDISIDAKGQDFFWDNDCSWGDVYGPEQDNYELPESKGLWD